MPNPTLEEMMRSAQEAGKARVAQFIPVVNSGGRPASEESANSVVQAKAKVAAALAEADEMSANLRHTAHVASNTDAVSDVEDEEFSTEAIERSVRSFMQRVGDDAGPQTITPQNKLYRPRGNTAAIMYDRATISGLDGPAGTGKSRACLEKLHIVAEKYPGCRLLICRKTRESLTEAALMTYETFVLPDGHPALEGPKRTHRQSYVYPNGSVINVVGLDKPQKIMSTEYDIIYIQEAIECLFSDVELLMSRLRNGVVPYQQIIFDCNPDAPTHWIHQQFIAGKIALRSTEHKDNPRWFEAAPDHITSPTAEYPEVSLTGTVGRWTEQGVSYIEKLQMLSGSRKERLLYGRWVTSEGQIYDEFSMETHMEDRFDPEPHTGKWYWICDFGYAKPACVQIWWIDRDGTPHLWKEIYKTRQLVEDLAAKTLEVCGLAYDPRSGHSTMVDGDGMPVYCTGIPDKIICDWDAEGRATFEKATGLRTVAASKVILEGIDAVKSRLQVQSNGKPGIKFMRGALVEVDEDLQTALQPISTIQEFSAYIWVKTNAAEGIIGKRERPVDEWNHGMDCLRYLVCDIDKVIGKAVIRGKDVPQIQIPSVRIIQGTTQQPHQPASPYGVHIIRATTQKPSRSERILMRRDRPSRLPGIPGSNNE